MKGIVAISLDLRACFVENGGMVIGGRDDAAPIDPFKESFKLCLRQGHRPVAKFGPNEARAFDTLVDQHEASAVPLQNLDLVASLRAEDEERTGEGVKFEIGHEVIGQAIHTLPEIDRVSGQVDTIAAGRRDH